ncbi:hypothetical protein CYY_000480 [Polysphondylium violaceum]|uniref:Aminotransferase n=1 Tax=Polysphondylium violaceum TaxID=133409 RepID=A0A8J4Q3Q6_9MYCE|nr:hypothetical protein CYY_000480 [Polysphondylium violaceum]
MIDNHEDQRNRDFSDEYFSNVDVEVHSRPVKTDTADDVSCKYYAGALKTVAGLVQSTALDTVGVSDLISSPFGDRLLTYCDFTASGRTLGSIEEYLLHEVIPLYANTHTLSDATGLQTTLFRREAREIVKRGCRGSNVEDVLLFVGSGATSAVNALVHILDIKFLSSSGKTPLVLLGPYEHHSNILPWREAGAQVLTCPEAKTGGVDTEFLQDMLKRFRDQDSERLIIGSFSAASNVSGIVEDTVAVTEILKRHNALSFWDYACAAPYVPIDMNPHNDNRYKKDALFFSPHKFLGGVGTPGVLCVKKHLLKNTVPYRPGGGSVLYVTPNTTTYLSNFEEKEEAGTPDIIGSIRCGLAFQLRENIGVDNIYQSELQHSAHIRSRLGEIKNLVMLGNNAQSSKQLPIISFLVRYAPDPSLFLHHNFVSSLLNDLFGIQTRASCACAGPYLECLLGLNDKDNREFLSSIFEKQEVVRPGMVRLNVNYTHSLQEVEFICSAVQFVVEHGWKLMPLYTLVVASGEWKHRSKLTKMIDRRWLSSISYTNKGKMSYESKRRTINFTNDMDDSQKLDKLISIKQSYLDQAHQLVQQHLLNLPKPLPDQSTMLTPDAQHLRWFALPTDVSNVLAASNTTSVNQDITLSTTLHKEIIIKPHKKYISGTNGLDQQEYEKVLANLNNLSTNEANQLINDNFVYPMINILNSISSNSNSSSSVVNSSSSSSKVDDTNQVGMVCPMKPKVKDNNLVEGKICINCFHDHVGTVKQEKNDTDGNNNNNTNISKSKECRSCECVSFVPRMEGTQKEQRTLQKKISSNVVTTITNYNMINDGDKIMVGVSGGKDSLTLVHTLLDIRRRSKAKFSIGVCTVDPQSPDYDPSPLKKYFESLNIPYFYISQAVMESAKMCMKDGNKASICAFCSRMRRGILYDVCRKEGYNVLALGQHLDDLSESFVMSAFYNGILSTMKVNYTNEQADLRVIRPLCNIRETQTRHYAKVMGLPVISENCPACFEAPKERQRIKLLLANQENINPMIHHILFKTMQPLITIDKTNRNSKRSIELNNNNPNIDIGDE